MRRSCMVHTFASVILLLAGPHLLPVAEGATSYSFDTSYADSISAEVGCFLSVPWGPIESVVSAFSMDFTTAAHADSPKQVDDNATQGLLFYTFRPTEVEFASMYAGFEDGKYIGYWREAGHLVLNLIQNENATCGKSHNNISWGCDSTYANSTSQRNGLKVGQTSSCCTRSYNPRIRPWYIAAKADTKNNGAIWTPPYTWGSSTGITAAQALFSSSGSFLGVVAIDIKLSGLTSILGSDSSTTNDGESVFTVFIVDTSGYLVATNPSGYEFRNGSRLPAVNCSYKTVRIRVLQFCLI